MRNLHGFREKDWEAQWLQIPATTRFGINDIPPAIWHIVRSLGKPESFDLKRRIEHSGRKTIIDYENDNLKYNQTYFLRNAIKCLVAARTLFSKRLYSHRGVIADLGGGIGTFSLSLYESASLCAFLVVDRSPTQVSLGIRLISQSNEFDRISYRIGNTLPSTESNDAVALFSFSLCESPWLLDDAVKHGWHTALIVDYAETLDRCESFASSLPADFIRMQTTAALSNILSNLVGQPSISVNGALLVYHGE